jgi:diguanylate cyclase (GGDEF)-like protein
LSQPDKGREETSVQPLPRAEDLDFAREANVILIAHPRGQALGTRYRLRPGSSLVIGRSSNAEIGIPEVTSISRTHARLEHRGPTVAIEDLGSTNGTYVNDQLVEGPTTLRSGDRFQVGAVHFKLIHEHDVEHAYHEAIHAMMMLDGLTEIFNRRKFDEEMAREYSRARRYGRPLTLLMCDIDHFKRINDTFGHLCGDFVLQKVVQRIKTRLRTEQIFARVGGEEFCVLCPETTAENVQILAERLREDIAGAPFVYGGRDVSVSCSFGVAERTGDMVDPEQLYNAADAAMYESKRRGRNTVTLSSGPRENRTPP